MRAPTVLLLLSLATPAAAEPLQPLIDATPLGGTLTLKPGTYEGPVTISRGLTLDGAGATIDGRGIGSVITITSGGVVVKNATLRRSGTNHESIDAAIRLRASQVVIKDNVFEDCLFGVDIQGGGGNIIRRNRMTSLDNDIGQRGEAIRIWYSNGNLVEGNRISRVRDMAVWYSSGTKVRDNVIDDARYGIHFMYAHDNEATGNVITNATVGLFLMYSNDLVVSGNRITYSQGPSGIAIGFKESSGARIEDNDLLANAVGLYLDASPYEPDKDNVFRANRLAFNGLSVLLHSDLTGNHFTGNDFTGNHMEVAVDGGGSAARNDWAGNHWDAYEGFDRNRDGIGDTPYENWAWSSRLWMDVKDAQFFRASPALEVLDFVERLAPVSEPRLLMRDAKPAIRPVAAAPRKEASR